MPFSTKQQLIGGGIILVVIGLLAWSTWSQVPRTSFSATTTQSTIASSTGSDVVARSVATSTNTASFPINASDTIASWNFKGPYTGNETLIAQANTDIEKLTALIGKGQYDDYDLYNGIANDYTSLGKGTLAYQYYNRSIRIHPTKGLAYANLAHLLDQLGAKETSADAYTKAVMVEPSILEYHIERLTYLTRQFPNDTARLMKAFADASKQFGDTPAILSIEARWLTVVGRYTDAIKDWQTVKALSPGKDMSAVDAEIARLSARH